MKTRLGMFTAILARYPIRSCECGRFREEGDPERIPGRADSAKRANGLREKGEPEGSGSSDVRYLDWFVSEQVSLRFSAGSSNGPCAVRAQTDVTPAAPRRVRSERRRIGIPEEDGANTCKVSCYGQVSQSWFRRRKGGTRGRVEAGGRRERSHHSASQIFFGNWQLLLAADGCSPYR
jgi:hypothetical protein